MLLKNSKKKRNPDTIKKRHWNKYVIIKDKAIKKLFKRMYLK